MRRRVRQVIGGVLLALATPAAGFVTFESGQVRPLALSPDGTRLFAVNTPDNRLEIFTVGVGTLTPAGSVPVGLEPVAVAARTNGEVWVVNHLSDSVSIVDVASSPPRVVRTLLVGDEPRDIVFAGSGPKAFISTAHRGQQRTDPSITGVTGAGDPQLTTQGVGRADVWVFDATNPGATFGGTPLRILSFFGDTPRALAVAPGGGTVYAAVFHSGNRTTAISEGVVCNGGSSAGSCTVGGSSYPGGLPAPNANIQGITGPETGLIVKFNPGNNRWEDRLGRNWNNAVKFSLPDRDVFAVNADTFAAGTIYTSVGTVLFNMAVNPVSGNVYVSNTEARNEVRFEGPGGGGSTVRGHLHEGRITVLSGATATARHLNKHINYAVVPSPAGVKDNSLAIPTGIAVSSNGATLYVAAFGSSKVGIFNTTQLENNTFTPTSADHVPVSGGGPSGLVLDEARSQLYVLTRFDNSISVVNTTTRTEVAHVPVYNPEPPSVVEGRPFLYDAFNTSSNGEASCAACHVFGDFDSLGWDLGNPDDVVLNNPNPIRVPDVLGISFEDFHPLKGPMTTQSLRGMADHGAMHWRGDRTGGNDPGGDPLDEDAAFKKFNVAFGGLLGRSGPLTTAEMQAFTDFILQVTYPPNPIRNLDDSLTTDQSIGRNFFLTSAPSDVFQTCNGCHTLDPANGFFGGDGFMSFENEPQLVKIPHLRNMYQKVGMFGMPQVPFFNAGDNGNKGNQIRGFGFLHDGSVDTMFRFHNATVFNQTNPGGLPVPNPGGFPNGTAGDPLRRQVEQFMLAFDSNLKPVVGQQVTVPNPDAVNGAARRSLLVTLAGFGHCDLIVKGVQPDPVTLHQRGWYRTSAGTFRSDRASELLLSDAALLALAAAGQELTYTAVPPGEGIREGVDRDEDGFFDRDELDAGSDPADPFSVPAGATTTTTAGGTTSTSSTTSTSTSTSTTTTLAFVLLPTRALNLRDDNVFPIDPNRRRISFKVDTTLAPPANRFVLPPEGSSGDPTVFPAGGGGRLTVYNANPNPGSPTDEVVVDLPRAGWEKIGTGARFKGYRWRSFFPDPITLITVKADKVSVRGGKSGWLYRLDEASQGQVAVRLTLGSSSWCTFAGAKDPASKNDHLDKFSSTRDAPAPVNCPALKSGGGGSPSGAFLEAE